MVPVWLGSLRYVVVAIVRRAGGGSFSRLRRIRQRAVRVPAEAGGGVHLDDHGVIIRWVVVVGGGVGQLGAVCGEGALEPRSASQVVFLNGFFVVVQWVWNIKKELIKQNIENLIIKYSKTIFYLIKT